ESAIRNFFKKTGRHSRNKKEQLMSPYTKKKKEQAYMEKRKITSPEDIQVIIELYNEGNSIRDIADLYQVSSVLIKSILKRNNIARRNMQEATNTQISKEKSRKSTLYYWKNLEQQGIGFWDKLEDFLQKHIQNFPIEKQQEEYERKRKEILQAMGSGRKKNIALNIFKNNIKFS
ncbi:MAG: helix-turn-helix domain-containing protein, partial [Clostridia bacterium]